MFWLPCTAMKICTGHDISISCRFYLLSFGLRKSRKFCQKEGQNQQLSQVLPAATRETKQTLIFEPLTPGLQDRHSRCCSTIHWGSKATPSNDTTGKTELWKMGENWVSNHRHLEYNSWHSSLYINLQHSLCHHSSNYYSIYTIEKELPKTRERCRKAKNSS